MRYETKTGGTVGAVLACGLLLILAGCAGEARTSAMVVDVDERTLIAEDSSLFQAVSVDAVSGGEETNPMWTSEVGNPEYKEALRLSLANHAMLAEDDGRFAVTAELLEVNQPFVGFDMTVTSVARYRLVDIASGETVFEETVTTPFTADFSSAFYGAERLRLANEGAIRENIRGFILLLIDQSETDGPLISMDGTPVGGITIASITVQDARGLHDAGVLR